MRQPITINNKKLLIISLNYNKYYIIIMKPLLLLLVSILIFTGCTNKFDKNDPLGKKNFPLLSQDSTLINFPQDFKGKPYLLGFIFTNCPDICPLTSHNFQLVQEEVRNQGIKGVNFVLISFDPDRDRPWVLKEYSGLRNIDESNFKFLDWKQGYN